MAKKKNPTRSTRSKRVATVRYGSSDELNSSDGDSSKSSSSETKRMTTKRNRSKQQAPIISSDAESNSSDNEPLSVAPSVENVSDNDKVPDEDSSNPSDRIVGTTGPKMSDFNCDVVVNVTRLSKNMNRVLAKHNLDAIYDSRTKKAIVRRHKKESNKKVMLSANCRIQLVKRTCDTNQMHPTCSSVFSEIVSFDRPIEAKYYDLYLCMCVCVYRKPVTTIHRTIY